MGDFEVVRKRLEELLPRISDKEIAIYPYGTVGKLCKFVLNEYYKINPVYLVDNRSHEDGVISSKCFYEKIFDGKRKQKYRPFLLFATADYRFIHALLPEVFIHGFHADDVGIIYRDSILSYKAIERVLALAKKDDTLLDIGCGPGIQGRIFEDANISVTGLTMDANKDYSGQCIANVVCGDVLDYHPRHKYDIVWCSHMLEHFPDVAKVLKKIRVDLLKEKGILAITVPARENTILMNHIHYFDAGRLLRYLLFSGFDCRNAEILEYGYNLSVILPEVSYLPGDMLFENEASHEPGDYHDGYGYDDMMKMFLLYLPKEIDIMYAWDGAPYFKGDIKELNWKELVSATI